MEPTKKITRKFTGVVVAAKMQKTIVVKIVCFKWHDKYLKQYKTSRKYKVHDETNEAKVGQQVEFIECRPISKDKRWRLVKIIK